jgi:hypothetical protein
MSSAINIIKNFFPDIKSMKDSKTSIKIEVTNHDDKVSRKGAHKDCALAVACKRKFKIDGVIIARSTAYLVKNNKAVRFDVPISVAREITSFDRGGGFAPGVYHLARPTKCPIGKNNHRSGPHLKKTNKKIARFRHVTSNIRAVLSGHEGD